MVLPTQRTDDEIVRLWSRVSNPLSWRHARSKFGDLLARFNPRYPQPGYIGKGYFESTSKVLLMGINPGQGRGYETRDSILFKCSLRLARNPDAENLESLMSVYREQMPAWTIFSRHEILKRLGVSFDGIAYMNVLHVNTNVGADDKRLGPVYRYAIAKYTRKQIELLQPHAIVHLGKQGWIMLNRYWPEADRPPGLEAVYIWHPSTQWVGRDRAGFEAQLEEARRLLRRKRRRAISRTS